MRDKEIKYTSISIHTKIYIYQKREKKGERFLERKHDDDDDDGEKEIYIYKSNERERNKTQGMSGVEPAADLRDAL